MSDYDFIWDVDDDGMLPVVIVFGSGRPGSKTYFDGGEEELIKKLSKHVKVEDVLVIYRYDREQLYLQLICEGGRFSKLDMIETTDRDEAVAEVRRISATPYRPFGKFRKKV